MSAGVKSIRRPRNAGARPNKIPVRTESAEVKARMRRSRWTAKWDGQKPPRDIKATRDRTLHQASRIPDAPPAKERSTLSVSNCLATRARPAPRASRTANSRWRAADRASISPATFAQAINKTMPTALIKIVSGLENLSCSVPMPWGAGINTSRGSSSALKSVFDSRRTSLRKRVSAAACACPSAIPRLRRATM